MVIHRIPLIFQFDEHLGYRGIPNAYGHIRRPSINKSFRLNKFGFYGDDFSKKPNDGIYRIAVFGASAVQGIWANQKESFASILGQKFVNNGYKVEVLNCGLSGQTRDLQNIAFVEYIEDEFKPNLILFELSFPVISINYYKDNHEGYSTLFTGENSAEYNHSRSVANRKVELLKKHKFITGICDLSYISRYIYRASSSNRWGTIIHCWQTYAANSVDSWQYYADTTYTLPQSVQVINDLNHKLDAKDCRLIMFDYTENSLTEYLRNDSSVKFNSINLGLPLWDPKYHHKLDEHLNEFGDSIIAQAFFDRLSKGEIPRQFCPK